MESANGYYDNCYFRVDLFAAYAYTCCILNAHTVAHKRADKPQKTTRAIRILF